MEDKLKQKLTGKKVKYIIGIVIVLMVVIIVSLTISITTKKSEPEIISKSTLEKIINVSDLSTFEAVYNGIAKVTEKDNPEKINYYVSYDAKVKAGVDFEKVDITVDTEEKIITVKLPEITLALVPHVGYNVPETEGFFMELQKHITDEKTGIRKHHSLFG